MAEGLLAGVAYGERVRPSRPARAARPPGRAAAGGRRPASGSAYRSQPSTSPTVGSGWSPSTPGEQRARTEPGRARASSGRPPASWKLFSQAASCAVWIALATRPGGDQYQHGRGDPEEAGKIEVNAAVVDAPSDRRPRERYPSSAPSPAESASPEAWNAASMKTAVSRPSRTTAKNAIATRAQAAAGGASAALARRSPASVAAWRRIHTIMKVTMPTATAATTVSSCSCWRWGSDWSSTCSADGDARCTVRWLQDDSRPTSPAAQSRRPCWRRKAAMIPTISDASTPSRKPITNVGNTEQPPRGDAPTIGVPLGSPEYRGQTRLQVK